MTSLTDNGIIIDAMITSVDDPQLPRCVEAVGSQTIPFSHVVHNNNVCPMNRAFQLGFSQTTGDWVVSVDGDMILDKNALERMRGIIDGSTDVSGYYFGLIDTFLQCGIGYLSVFNGHLYRKQAIPDHPVWDSKLVRRLTREGWRQVKLFHVRLGTHFDNPDEYQVFKRFYIHGFRYARYPRRSIRPTL